MDTKKTIFYLIAVALLAVSCSQQTATVATDRDLETGEFDKYKTFTFASHVTNAANNMFFMDSELMKLAIADEVKGELEALGYEYVEGANADLLVNFRVLSEDTEYQGWVDNYADENYWGPMEIKKEAIGLEPSAQVREPGDAKTYYLKEGTILVQMADMDKNVVVWQGYASGIVENDTYLDSDEPKIAEAVERLFDEYNFEAAEGDEGQF